MKYQDEKIYHIYNKGCDKNLIFFNERNYKYLIRKMRHNADIYDVSIIVFCLMPDRYHFLFRQNANGSISEFLKSTFASYTSSVNKEQEINGKLFKNVPQSSLIDKIDYLKYLIWHIHHNPVKAGLISKPEEWLYSNYQECIGKKKKYPFDLKIISELFGSQFEYKKFMDNFKDDHSFDLDFKKYLT